MSFFFPKLRRIPDQRDFIRDIVQRLAKIQAQQNRPESDEVDFIRLSRRDDDKLILTDGAGLVEISSRSKIFTLPNEPDGEFLVAWYKFDDVALSGVAKDHSGYRNHAIIPSTILTSGLDNNPINVFGINEGAFRFDGTSDYLIAPDSESLQVVKGASGFSISVWIKPHSINFQGSAQFPIVRRILSKSDDAANGFTLAITPFQTILFGIKTSAALGAYFFAQTPVGSINVLNKWYHVVCTYDNLPLTADVDRIRIYLDNEEMTVPTNFMVAMNTDLTLDLFIAARDPFVDNPPPFSPGDVAGFFGGELDDLRIYKNRILTKVPSTGLAPGVTGLSVRLQYGVIKFPVGTTRRLMYDEAGVPAAEPVSDDEISNLYTNRRTITTLIGSDPNRGVAMVGRTHFYVVESFSSDSFAQDSFEIQT